MSTAIPIILIVIVWLFVLAPWLLRSQRPMSHTGEAFEETRVLYEGDSGDLAGAPRPRARQEDAARATASAHGDEEEEYEIVDADTPDEVGTARAVGKPEDTVEGEIVDEDDDVLVEDTEDEPEEAVDEGAEGSAEEDEDESFEPVEGEIAEDAYDFNETYTSPVDLMYPGAVDAQEQRVAAEVEEPEEVQEDTELSDEEVAFAQSRRGGWDPVADKKASADRYQRRQRTLLGLVVAVVATVAVGIVVGGWTWWLAAVAGVLTLVYLIALRNQVRQEKALLRRRVQHLRRARLGVRNAADEELAIPRNLRRPGAVVIESDDDSPDFVHLPVHDGDDRFDDEPPMTRRTDELAARRVS
ncbi:divisome protein SepX/GlpR [Corynebacterium camporealensis]